MKFNFLISLLILLSFSFVPKKAEAGVLIYAIGTIDKEEDSVECLGVITASIGGFLGLINLDGGGIGWKIPIILITLQSDGTIEKGYLENEFVERYSFIDNADVIDNMSSVVKKKFIETKNNNGSSLVRLSEDEVREILSPIDLTEKQILTVVKDLN